MFTYCFEYIRQTDFLPLCTPANASTARLQIRMECLDELQLSTYQVLLLSQFGMNTMASNGVAIAVASMESAMILRVAKGISYRCGSSPKPSPNTNCIGLDWRTTCVADTVFFYGLYNIFKLRDQG